MDLFGTAGIRGSATESVTPALALRVGRAVAIHARDHGDRTFLVGRDGRVTGGGLLAALEAGLMSGGARVLRLGQVPTPTLGYASVGSRGVMVTASHNPPMDNGLKLFVDGYEYSPAAEAEVERLFEEAPAPVSWADWGTPARRTVLGDYRQAAVDYATELVGRPSELRVAVDCGNGMAAKAAPQALRSMGADVVALNANVDGRFPGRDSKPTAESITDLRAFTADSDVDLGLAADGDADRLVVVDANGTVIHEDTILAVLAELYVEQATCEEPVVITTPNASARIDERVTEHGGSVERVALGSLHEGLRRRAADGTAYRVVFAAEPWKHIHPQFGPWIDGIVSALVLGGLVAARGLEALVAPITERPYRKESVACPDAQKAPVMRALPDRLAATFPDAKLNTARGLRLTFEDASWVLVRPSGTEPLVRLYAESERVQELIESTRIALQETLEGVEDV